MATNLSLVLIVTLLGAVTNSSQSVLQDKSFAPRENSEFLYLGRINLKRGGKVVVDSDYYVSVNPAAWNNAEQDCEAHFANNGGSFIMIETEEERDGLNKMLERFGSGKLYWTGGLHANKWVWSSNGKDIPTFAIPASPPTPTSQDRLILNHKNRFSSDFEILQDSQPQRYICEVSRCSAID